MTDELKPVPCGCGGEPYLKYDDGAYSVMCTKCGIETKGYCNHFDDFKSAKEYATKDWNRAMGARKWTPVAEALPKDRDWYLGIFMESDTEYVIPVPYVCDYVGRETPITTKDFWILRDIDEPHEYHKNLKCVAWMPLPEPWKGE